MHTVDKKVGLLQHMVKMVKKRDNLDKITSTQAHGPRSFPDLASKLDCQPYSLVSTVISGAFVTYSGSEKQEQLRKSMDIAIFWVHRACCLFNLGSNWQIVDYTIQKKIRGCCFDFVTASCIALSCLFCALFEILTKICSIAVTCLLHKSEMATNK